MSTLLPAGPLARTSTWYERSIVAPVDASNPGGVVLDGNEGGATLTDPR
jgi:hypothetical protein